MNVTYAHICDYASISREGKLSAMGIFDRIYVPAFPGVQNLMHLAYELELRPAELRQPFDLTIKLVNQDGAVLVEMAGRGSIDAQVQAGTPLRVPQILALGGVPLPQAGSYSLDIFINGDHKYAVTFFVAVVTEAPPGLQGLPE